MLTELSLGYIFKKTVDKLFGFLDEGYQNLDKSQSFNCAYNTTIEIYKNHYGQDLIYELFYRDGHQRQIEIENLIKNAPFSRELVITIVEYVSKEIESENKKEQITYFISTLFLELMSMKEFRDKVIAYRHDLETSEIHKITQATYEILRHPEHKESFFAESSQDIDIKCSTFLSYIKAEIEMKTQLFIGREWLFKDFEDWLKNKPQSRVFFITGDPGTGKSAIMAKITKKYKEIVVASHFCIISWPETVDSKLFIFSLARQLAIFSEEVKDTLKKISLKDISSTSDMMLFYQLIIHPLHLKKFSWTVLVVIDALDEAFINKNSPIINLLIACISNFPQQFRFVISSRKDSNVINRFSKYNPYEINAKSKENIEDISSYIEKRLQETELVKKIEKNGIDNQQFKDIICKKSQGNFLYVVIVLEGILEDSYDLSNPDCFPQGLNGIYQEFFRRISSDGFNENFDYIGNLLNIICAAEEPLTAKQIGIFADIEEFKVEETLKKMSVYFHKENNKYVPYHKSVIDWLTAEKGNEGFRINIKHGHKLIAANLREKFYKHNKRDEYILTNLPFHLLEADLLNELVEVLTDFAFAKAKCERGQINQLIKDYELAINSGYFLGEQFSTLKGLYQFFKIQVQILSKNPELLLQQINNESNESCVPKVMKNNKEPSKDSYLWLRLINKNNERTYGALDKNYDKTVTACAYSPDDKYFALVSYNGKIKIFDTQTGEFKFIEQSLNEYAFKITACAFSTDNKYIVLATDNYMLVVLDIKTGKSIGKSLTSHTEKITVCAFLPNNEYIVSASDEGTLMICDVKTCIPTDQPLKNHLYKNFIHAYSTDTKHIVSVSESDMCTLIIKDAQLGCQIGQPLKGHTNLISACAYSPDNKHIISASWDCTLIIWDALTGKRVSQPLVDHTSWVIACTYSPDNRYIISMAYDYELIIWDAQNGNRVGYPLESKPLGKLVKNHYGDIKFATPMNLFKSPNNEYIVLVSRDGWLTIQDAQKRTKKMEFFNDDKINNIKWSHNSNFLVGIGNFDKVYILELMNIN